MPRGIAVNKHGQLLARLRVPVVSIAVPVCSKSAQQQRSESRDARLIGGARG